MAIINCWTPGYRFLDAMTNPSVSGMSFSTSIERGEGASLRINPITTATSFGSLGSMNGGVGGTNNSTNAATVTVRFYLYIATAPASGSEEIIGISQNPTTTAKLYVRLNSARQLLIYDSTATLKATGAYAIPLSTWVRVEVFCNTGTSATAEVRIYSDNDTTPTLLDTITTTTANLTSTNCGYVLVGKQTNRSGQTYDIHVATFQIRNDSTNPGHAKGKILLPDANGTYTAFTGGTGGYQECDELPHDGLTTFVSNASVNQAESFGLQSTANVGLSGTETINAFVGVAVASKNGSTVNTAVLVRSNTTDINYLSGDLTTAWTLRGYCLPTDPATGAAWTHGGVNAVEVGMKNTGAPGGLTRITAVYGYVEYVPLAASGATPRTQVVWV